MLTSLGRVRPALPRDLIPRIRAGVLFGLAVLLLVGFTPAVVAQEPVTAPSTDSLAECARAASDTLEAAGARPAGQLRRQFLLTSQTESLPYVLAEDGCVGFLAVGHRRVQDLDLALHTDGGTFLSRDIATNASPWVRFCGAAGLRVVVTVYMYKGRGEYRLMAFDNAPERLPDLNRSLGACFASSAGLRSGAPDLAEEPALPTASDSAERTRLDLADRGYRLEGPPRVSRLAPRAEERRSVPLVAGRCYAIMASGGRGVLDLDLTLRDEAGREVASDDGRARDAAVGLCPERSTTYQALVQMHDGSGEYALQVFALDESQAPPEGIDGDARLAFGELAAVLAERGMRARPLAWGAGAPGRSLTLPVELEVGRCYALAAVPSAELLRADLDVVLLDPGASLEGWDVGRSPRALVFHCAQATGTYQLVVRVFGGVGRFLLLLATEADVSAEGRP